MLASISDSKKVVGRDEKSTLPKLQYCYQRNIAHGKIALQRQSEAYAMACIQPAYDCFASKFLNNGDPLQPAVEIFKAARLFKLTKIAEIQPTGAILSDQLRKVPFLNNDSCIDGLQGTTNLHCCSY